MSGHRCDANWLLTNSRYIICTRCGRVERWHPENKPLIHQGGKP